MFNKLCNKIKEDKFEDLFQPVSGEELKVRQKERVDKALEDGRCTLNEDGTYSCEGDVKFPSLHVSSLPVKFKIVKGFFDCGETDLTASANELTTLEGCPKYVGGYFCCSANLLTSLEGGPEKVGGDYSCSYNQQLSSLKGIAGKIGGILFITGTRISNKLGLATIKGSELYKYIKQFG